jgi:hypothetical protein
MPGTPAPPWEKEGTRCERDAERGRPARRPRRHHAARRSALDEVLAPLLELAAPLRTGAQRDALAAYVPRRLCEARNPRRPPGGRQ